MTDRLELTHNEIRALKAFAGFLLTGGRSGSMEGSQPPSGGGRVASPSELMGRYGDPTVRKDSKRWAGPSYVGASFSRCPAEYLTVLADFLDWKADQESPKPDAKKHANGKFYWEFDRKDAALARGWASRNEGRAFPPPNQSAESSGSSDEPMDPGDMPADSYGDPAEEPPF